MCTSEASSSNSNGLPLTQLIKKNKRKNEKKFTAKAVKAAALKKKRSSPKLAGKMKLSTSKIQNKKTGKRKTAGNHSKNKKIAKKIAKDKPGTIDLEKINEVVEDTDDASTIEAIVEAVADEAVADEVLEADTEKSLVSLYNCMISFKYTKSLTQIILHDTTFFHYINKMTI